MTNLDIVHEIAAELGLATESAKRLCASLSITREIPPELVEPTRAKCREYFRIMLAPASAEDFSLLNKARSEVLNRRARN